MLGKAIELGHASVDIAPKTFDTVDVALTRSESIGSVFDSEILVKDDINEPFVTRPAIRMDNRSWVNVTPYNPLERDLCPVRHDFCEDHTLALYQTKDIQLAVVTLSAAVSNPCSIEVELIILKRPVQWLSHFTEYSQSLAHLRAVCTHRTKRDIRHFTSHFCRQIHRSTTLQLVKFSLYYFRTALMLVLSNHYYKFS